MSKRKDNKTEQATEQATEQTVESEQEQAIRKMTPAEFEVFVKTLPDDEQKTLRLLIATPANELAGTKGQFFAASGEGYTTDRELAKLATNGKPIPRYTPARTTGITAIDSAVPVGKSAVTHKQETEQLRRQYASGWGQNVISALRVKMEKLGRSLTDSERDRTISANCPKSAWLPRYCKDNTPASQFARHLAVIEEFLKKQ